MDRSIAQVVVGLPVEGPFDYALPAEMREKAAVGSRVKISFGPRRKIGYIVGFSAKSKWRKLKSVSSLIDSVPVLDEAALKLTKELAEYYACSWGEAIEAYLPEGLRKGRTVELNLPQATAAKPVSRPQIVLVHDAGQAKRWPYLLAVIKENLSAGRGVIFLIPEASLADLVAQEFKKTGLDQFTIWDRGLKPAEELEQWAQIKSGQTRLVVGTRSAVFAPMPNLGLIVVYEEENRAYKQEQSPNYHSRQVARFRGQLENCAVMLVSSCPSAETWYEAQQKKIDLVSLEAERLGAIQLVDLANYNSRKTSLVSFPLRNQIEKTIFNRGKVVLLMNRRGFATTTRCNQCGFTLKCERCDTKLTYLYSKKKLVCRHCNFSRDFPKKCPECGSAYLRSMGTGIEKLESELSRTFPQARVEHYDRETSTTPPNFDILIATQAVLRLQHRLAVNLAGVILFDSELNRMDFRSGEHAFSLLIHLRQLASEKLYVQTRMTENYCLAAARKLDFKGFYREELKTRKDLNLPPFRHLVAIHLRSHKEAVVFAQAAELYEALAAKTKKAVEVSEPHPDANPKLRDQYRFSIILKSKNADTAVTLARKALRGLKKKSGVIMTIDVDP